MRCNKVIIIGVLLPQLLLSYYIASHLYSILFYSIDSRAKTFFNLQAGRARTFFSPIGSSPIIIKQIFKRICNANFFLKPKNIIFFDENFLAKFSIVN